MKRQLIIICLTLTCLAMTSQAQENLKIAWPGDIKWKIASNQKSGNTRMVELIPENETTNNWTILGTMVSIMGAKPMAVEKYMNMTFNQTVKNAPKAKLTMIEKGVTSGYPWILFRVESPGFKNSKIPESQLYYIIQSRNALYSNFVAVKQPSLGVLFVEKWVKVFKNSALVNK